MVQEYDKSIILYLKVYQFTILIFFQLVFLTFIEAGQSSGAMNIMSEPDERFESSY